MNIFADIEKFCFISKINQIDELFAYKWICNKNKLVDINNQIKKEIKKEQEIKSNNFNHDGLNINNPICVFSDSDNESHQIDQIDKNIDDSNDSNITDIILNNLNNLGQTINDNDNNNIEILINNEDNNNLSTSQENLTNNNESINLDSTFNENFNNNIINNEDINNLSTNSLNSNNNNDITIFSEIINNHFPQTEFNNNLTQDTETSSLITSFEVTTPKVLIPNNPFEINNNIQNNVPNNHIKKSLCFNTNLSNNIISLIKQKIPFNKTLLFSKKVKLFINDKLQMKFNFISKNNEQKCFNQIDHFKPSDKIRKLQYQPRWNNEEQIVQRYYNFNDICYMSNCWYFSSIKDPDYQYTMRIFQQIRTFNNGTIIIKKCNGIFICQNLNCYKQTIISVKLKNLNQNVVINDNDESNLTEDEKPVCNNCFQAMTQQNCDRYLVIIKISLFNPNLDLDLIILRLNNHNHDCLKLTPSKAKPSTNYYVCTMYYF
jgi:hypothetical protein